MISEAEGLDIWRRASALPASSGIAVQTENRYNLMQRLYSIRAKHKDREDFSHLMLAYGPRDNEVWVIHRPGITVAEPIKPMTEGDLNGI